MNTILKSLAWLHAMGADEAISSEARDYFVLPAKPSAAPTAPIEHAAFTPSAAPVTAAFPAAASMVASPPPTFFAYESAYQEEKLRPMATLLTPETLTPDSAIAKARALAEKADTIAALEEAVRGFDGCAIKFTATNTVFRDGNPDSDMMVIGEAPGASEDAQGIPFCGESGKLLDQMFGAIGKTRENYYITNTIFWRPPGNRRPTPEELASCLPFVEKHIALIRPKLLVLVGGTATAALLTPKEGITALRKRFHEYTNGYLDYTVPVAALFHPSYLLRQPTQKRFAWQDLLKIRQFLEKGNA